jgi:hypothetical protein
MRRSRARRGSHRKETIDTPANRLQGSALKKCKPVLAEEAFNLPVLVAVEIHRLDSAGAKQLRCAVENVLLLPLDIDLENQ